jgi:hypothetical protein
MCFSLGKRKTKKKPDYEDLMCVLSTWNLSLTICALFILTTYASGPSMISPLLDFFKMLRCRLDVSVSSRL